MIKIENKLKCCGCEACVQKCPVQCISLQEDAEGFQYPLVDPSRCIDCKACERVCQYNYPVLPKALPLKVLAAKHLNESIRMKSSSGGMFHLLAEQVLQQGGVVFGVRFDKQWNAVFAAVERMEDLPQLMGSKYMQSRVGDAYVRVRSYLKQQRPVLFTGTSCQIRGLKRFLGRDYEQLYSVAIVCHGVPSPKVWRTYLSSRGGTIRGVNFRSKHMGWHDYQVDIQYEKNGSDALQVEAMSHHKNAYMNSFLSDVTLRPSCHQCDFKWERGNADLIIGDFWNIREVLPSMDDDKGTSVVIVNSNKGASLLDDVPAILQPVPPHEALNPTSNGGFHSGMSFHPNRKRFFSQLGKQPFDELVYQSINHYPFIYRLKRKLSVIYHQYLKL